MSDDRHRYGDLQEQLVSERRMRAGGGWVTCLRSVMPGNTLRIIRLCELADKEYLKSISSPMYCLISPCLTGDMYAIEDKESESRSVKQQDPAAPHPPESRPMTAQNRVPDQLSRPVDGQTAVRARQVAASR
jgi:hypothetical protein